MFIIIMVQDDKTRESGRKKIGKFNVYFDALKQGFLTGCRPAIHVDRCYLKGPYSGILLTTLLIDPNNSLYPIGYVVVSRTTKEAWEWFLGLLKDGLGIERLDFVTFISDKQRGLIPAFELVFPGAENRFCVRHLRENFKKARFRGLTFKPALWNAVAAATVREYELRMKKRGELDETSLKWFNDKPPSHWTHLVVKSLVTLYMSPIVWPYNWQFTIMLLHLPMVLSYGKKLVSFHPFLPNSEGNGERLARERSLGTNEPRNNAKRGRRRKGPVRIKKQLFKVQCHYCGNPGHNQLGSKKRKADIAACLSRDFASPINANVENAIGNDATPFGKTPVLSQFRPPSPVVEPTTMPTPVPQPRVNIAPNHPILSQSPIVNSQGGVQILIGRGGGQ
ncbi:hypothetical protein BUALT_Bualt14G0003800 [Buddleja alternifolia]|uniref:MULE transposase domain-containing protein n=1 Tax=Buddleja alternifolia TaxID=168488 RepID=A0AAV6WFR0_9LAMI|nr:hypothetical protein BUALT_Bualt14G0003800 [Buddleja alternifolia]